MDVSCDCEHCAITCRKFYGTICGDFNPCANFLSDRDGTWNRSYSFRNYYGGEYGNRFDHTAGRIELICFIRGNRYADYKYYYSGFAMAYDFISILSIDYLYPIYIFRVVEIFRDDVNNIGDITHQF